MFGTFEAPSLLAQSLLVNKTVHDESTFEPGEGLILRDEDEALKRVAPHTLDKIKESIRKAKRKADQME